MTTETQKPIDPEVLDKLHWVPGEVAVCEGLLLFRRDRAIHVIGTVRQSTAGLERWSEESDDGQEPEI